MTFTNLSPDPSRRALVQHPAFGSPFLDDDSYVVTSARTLITDADAPGSLASANVSTARGVLPAGPIPGQHRAFPDRRGASLFAALTDFASPEARSAVPTADSPSASTWDGAHPPPRVVLDRGERRFGLAVVPAPLRCRHRAGERAPRRRAARSASTVEGPREWRFLPATGHHDHASHTGAASGLIHSASK